MKSSRILLSVIWSVLFMISCTRFHDASPELDAKAKAMTAPQDKALVYLYRDVNGGGRMNVSIDGRNLGVIGGRNFMMFMLSPGKHLVVIEAANRDEMDLEVKPGETYYIRQDITNYLYVVSSKMMLMHNMEGKKGVQDCVLVEHKPVP